MERKKSKELDPYLQELVDEMWALADVMGRYIRRIEKKKSEEHQATNGIRS